jgi:hypothetical protein
MDGPGVAGRTQESDVTCAHAVPSARCTAVQVIINCGALPCLLNLLVASHKKSIKKEACWTISNITAGTKWALRGWARGWGVGPLRDKEGPGTVCTRRRGSHAREWVGRPQPGGGPHSG